MSRIGQIQRLVRDGLYYLTQHADEEAAMDGFDIYDVEQAILTGKIRKTWPKQGKFEVVGSALDDDVWESCVELLELARFAL